MTDGSQASGLRDALLALAFAVAGVAAVSWAYLAGTSGLAGEPALCAYYLEHGMRALWWSDYPFGFWAAPMCWPFQTSLTLSDNLAGAAPIYWLLRLVLSPEWAYRGWESVCITMTTAGTIWFMRRWGCGWAMAVAAGYVYGLGTPHILEYDHAQLQTTFYAPLVLHALFRFAQDPSARWFAAMCAGLALQTLAAIYVGWFLILGAVLFLLVWLLSSPRARAALLAERVRSRPLAWLAAPAVCAAILLLFLRPYLHTLGDTGGWRFNTIVAPMLVAPADYFIPPENGAARGLSCLSPGWPAFAVFALALAIAFRSPARLPCSSAIRASLIAALILTLLTLRFGEISAWRVVFELVPGARAIRAVSRVWLASYLLAIPASFLVVDERMRRLAPRFVRAGLVWILPVFPVLAGRGYLAQLQQDDPSGLRLTREERADLLEILPRGTVGCVAVPPAPRNLYFANIDVMWAAMEAGIPVVNGSSGAEPPGFRVDVQDLRARDVCRQLGTAVTGVLQIAYADGVPIRDPWLAARTGAVWRTAGSFRVVSLPVPCLEDLQAPRYTLGDTIRPDGTNADFHGWQRKELLGRPALVRYSHDRPGEISFRLEDRPAGLPDRLLLVATVASLEAQGFELRVNGKTVARSRICPDPSYQLGVEMASALLRWNSTNRICFEAPAGIPPATPVGFALHHLRIRPVP